MKAQNDRQTDKRMASILSGIKRGGADCDRQFLDRLRAQSSAEFVSSSAGNVSRTRTNGAMPTWRVVAKSRIARIGAAAVVIAAALIGIKVLFNPGEQPAEVPAPQPPVSGVVGKNLDSAVDIELRQVREMYAAGDVTGLATMLAEGEFESQVLAANYLAKMEGGAEALDVLEKVQAGYGKDDPGNPFTSAVERISNNNASAVGRSSPSPGVSGVQGLPEPAPDDVLASPSVERPKEGQASLTDATSSVPLTTELEERSGEVLTDSPGGPVLTEGVSGSAYYFDGIGNYIDIKPGQTLPFGSQSYTVAMWVYPNNIGKQAFFTRGELSKNQLLAIVYYPSGGGLRVNHYDNDLQTKQELANGQWYYLAVTYDGAYTSLYLNGTYVDSLAKGTLNLQNTFTRIGDYREAFYSSFDGTIDEVAIFNKALSEAEISGLYRNKGRLRGNEAGLAAYWNFDNDEGYIVKDSSQNHNDGVLRNDPEAPYRQPKPTVTEGASGKGYYFDGDGDYIEIPPIEGLGTEQTKMLWVYADGFMRSHSIYLIDEGGRESNNNWIELLDSDGNGVPNIRAGFDAGNLFDSDGEIEAGYWYHIAVVSTSAGDVFTYINGLFDSTHGGFSAKTQPKGIVIGAASNRGGDFKGVIDEVAIFNRALSDDEIWRIHQNTGRLRGNEPGLVGYWNFDRDQGDVVRDMSPYENHGKLGGM
jgi:hypothetical protein